LRVWVSIIKKPFNHCDRVAHHDVGCRKRVADKKLGFANRVVHRVKTTESSSARILNDGWDPLGFRFHYGVVCDVAEWTSKRSLRKPTPL
jgi:hypothetical protein